MGWLALIALIGAANGFFLGLGLGALLGVLLRALERAPAPTDVGLIAGGCLALAVIVISLLRERALAEREVPTWVLHPPRTAHEAALERVTAELARKAGLAESPRVRLIEGRDPNAFTLGERSDDGVAIMLTEGALKLPACEVRAVLAQQIAHIAAGDLRTVALADSVQATVAYLGDVKGRWIWDTGQVIRRVVPLLVVLALATLGYQAIPEGPRETISVVIGLGIVVVIWLNWELGKKWNQPLLTAGRRYLVAVGQLGLWLSLLGPMSLAEALLAWPTVYFLARCLSRDRVYAADQFAVTLTGDAGALRDALVAVATIEDAPAADERFDRLRFSLFATPRARTRYRAMVEQFWGTHPPVECRIAKLTG
jgi:Zn-dependent protease with chaperone function